MNITNGRLYTIRCVNLIKQTYVAQLVEAKDLKSFKYGFESRHRYFSKECICIIITALNLKFDEQCDYIYIYN